MEKLAKCRSDVISEALRNAGQILINKADEIGDDLVNNKGVDLNIWVRCDPGEVPTIEIQSTYLLS